VAAESGKINPSMPIPTASAQNLSKPYY